MAPGKGDPFWKPAFSASILNFGGVVGHSRIRIHAGFLPSTVLHAFKICSTHIPQIITPKLTAGS